MIRYAKNSYTLPALLAAAIAASSASADTAIWNGTTGNWSDATRWSTNPNYPNNGFPAGATYDVTIPAGSVSLDIVASVSNLELSNATLTGINSLSVVNNFNVLGDSTLSGSGTLTAGNLALAPFSFTMAGTRSLVAFGSNSWSVADGFPQFVTLSPTNTFTNLGTFNLSPSDFSAWNGGNIINIGTINKVGATSLFISSALTNNGSITAQDGNLTLNFGTHSGSFTTSTAGSITFTGTNAFSSGSTVNGNVTFADDAVFNGTTLGGRLAFYFTAAFNAGTRINAASLEIAGDATLRTGTSSSSTGALSIAGTPNAWTGRLDLTDNAMVVRPAPADKAVALSTMQNHILSGKNNGTAGTFTGPGITSSTLATAAAAGTLSQDIALADNADLGLTSFRGQNGLDSNSLILTIAHLGDTNLDNKVDAFDLNLLAARWQQASGAAWSDGDFTLDGRVDAFDLNLLAANWQFGATGALVSFQSALADYPHLWGATPVPEPSTVALLPAAALLLLRRRNRRRS